MNAVSADDFDKSMIPTHLKKEAKELIAAAVMSGWTLHVTASNACTIKSPVGDKTHHFGAGGRATKSNNILRRDIVKYGDPTKVSIIGKVLDGQLPDSALAILPDLTDPGVTEDQRPETEEPKPVRVVPPPTPPKPQAHEARIISIKPMVAKASKGYAYESETTFERKWNDGTTDYACQGCDTFHSVDRLAVSRHYAGTHSRKEPVSPPRTREFKAETASAGYAPRMSRVEALAAALEEAFAVAMSIGSLDIKAVAEKALTWVHEQSCSGTEFAAEREPMTAEDTLSRIRAMLDTGQAARQEQEIAALTDSLRETNEKLAETQAAAEAAEVKAREARDNLSAFRALVLELPIDETEDKA